MPFLNQMSKWQSCLWYTNTYIKILESSSLENRKAVCLMRWHGSQHDHGIALNVWRKYHHYKFFSLNTYTQITTLMVGWFQISFIQCQILVWLILWLTHMHGIAIFVSNCTSVCTRSSLAPTISPTKERIIVFYVSLSQMSRKNCTSKQLGPCPTLYAQVTWHTPSCQ